MYRHLLVPIDDTELAVTTVYRAVEFARCLGARITFFHARGDYAAAREQFPWFPDGQLPERLARAEAVARDRGVDCESVTTVSDLPHRDIVATARAAGCDLIFLSSHGRRAQIGMMLGSQTMNVLTRSEIPVLVTAERNPTLAARTIGIIRDEHRSTMAALQAGLRLLRNDGPRTRPEMLRALADYIERYPLEMHHPKEDELFRRLRERTREVDVHLDEVERQHLRDEQLVEGLESAIGRYCEGRASAAEVEEVLAAYAGFTRDHQAREERVILPAALHHLTDHDWEEAYAAFADNEAPRFGGEAEAEYRAIFARMAAANTAPI